MAIDKCDNCWRLQIKIANAATEVLKMIYNDNTLTKAQKDKLDEIHKILRNENGRNNIIE